MTISIVIFTFDRMVTFSTHVFGGTLWTNILFFFLLKNNHFREKKFKSCEIKRSHDQNFPIM